MPEKKANMRQERQFPDPWTNELLTPGQAYAIATAMVDWARADLEPWLSRRQRQPLHQCRPFSYLDPRVMMVVDDNTAIAAAAAERCRVVSDEIKRGTLPFDRNGCYFDEVLLGAALHEAPDFLTEKPELIHDSPIVGSPMQPRTEGGRRPASTGAVPDDWEHIAYAFGLHARWPDSSVPAETGNAFLPLILETRPPSRWFDLGVSPPSLTSTFCAYLGVSESAWSLAQAALVSQWKRAGRAHTDHDRLD